MTEIKESPLVETAPYWHKLVANVAVNPTQIEWARDEHGITMELRKAFTQAAMKCKGNPDKEEVLIANIMIGLAHVRKRIKKDAEVQAERIADIKKKAEARKPLERFHAYKGSAK
jgi:hypothetical protein